ncbi:MAG TPA: GNAT family N-acetyltransferase [Candidatus Dormibacteraeota bacterium]|nr:GNAT family N-acetyltransferase [Candidatus Dormibacteraeota bacterium]
MTVEIRELFDLGDLRNISGLFAVVWGRPAEPPLDSDLLKALAHSGNYVSGAFADGRLVGGLVGWLGGDPRHELHMHSHILGVLPDTEARGVGFDLKQHQRGWCLERGVKLMEWTTDPLVRRNAYFNLTKLGAEAPRYLVNFYGEMKDGLNAGEESDRLLIRWVLDSDRANEAATGHAPELDAEKLGERAGNAIVAVGPSGEPVITQSSARVLICQVPDDIVALRHSDPGLARAWRKAVRDALGGALARGYAISGATRSGWYVLEKQQAEKQ